MTPEMTLILNIILAVLGFLCSTAVTGCIVMLMKLNDKQIKADERASNYKEETERRFQEQKAENDRRFLEVKNELDRRFAERNDQRIQEKLYDTLQLKTATEKSDSQYAFIKGELMKLEASVIAVHKRLDNMKNVCPGS